MALKSQVLKSVEARLNETLRPELAQGWDNVGLLVGDPGAAVRRLMLCIDLTPAVLREAQARRTELVLAYHPPIFEPVKSVRSDRQEVIYQAIRSNIAIYSIHTALDVLPGGTSDALADLVDLIDRKPVDLVEKTGGGTKSKLVVFVPYEIKVVEKVSLAIFRAGAGRIGEYSCCSFLAAGNGTFLGSEKTHPAVGKAGQFETVEEMRIEVVVENRVLPEVVRALKAAHPYEEPAYDIYPLAKVAGEELGLGRIGRLAKPMDLKTIAARIKGRTGLKHLQIVDGGKKKLSRVAVGPGSCGKMLEALEGKIDLFITGEVRHHGALAAVGKGTSVICLGHGNSERIALKGLQHLLKSSLPGLDISISNRDADPLTIY
jgi:dinuclear metal center YbgI/SA1388 family protein